jgi:hypothetical protein
MFRTSVCVLSLLMMCCVLPISAQQPAAAANGVVPPMVKFSGVLTDVNGKSLTGVVGVTFSLYKDSQGGAPLWMETQNVQADKNGHYSVMLGSSTSQGLPGDPFVSGEARWLGVQAQGQAEQPRTLLMSVPYALKAADAETLSGKPLSAFQLAAPQAHNGSRQSVQPATEQPNEIRCAGSAACKTSFVPVFSTNGGSAKVGDSIISQSGSTVTISGSEQITGNETVAGNVTATNVTATGKLVATATSGNGNAILASSAASNATVIYGGASSSTGATWAVEGDQYSSDPGAYGVFGIGHNGGVGVTGRNDATGGIGVLATAPNGIGIYTDSNVQQARTMGGWVKAMVHVNALSPPYSIINCFNSTLAGAAATTPPCGINFTEAQLGEWSLDFGFEVDDRFMSATLVMDPSNVNRCISVEEINTIAYVWTTDCGNSLVTAQFYLLVF